MVVEKEKIHELQQIELGILSAFQDICEKHGFRYFAIGGTCIGAIRHKGFIPWDDDIDVAMPVEDYYRLVEIAEKELPNPYKLVKQNDIKYYHLHYIRIENSNTTFIQNYMKSWPDRWRGVFIDVMPITGLPTDDIKRKKYLFKLKIYKGLNSLRRMPYSFHKTIQWRISWIAFSLVKWCVPYSFFSDRIDDLRKRNPFAMSDQVLFSWTRHQIESASEKKNIFPYSDFSEYIEIPFERQTIRVPKGYDDYLKADFGDYLQLPPENKRKSDHQVCFIDVNTSYRYYQKNGLPGT